MDRSKEVIRLRRPDMLSSRSVIGRVMKNTL